MATSANKVVIAFLYILSLIMAYPIALFLLQNEKNLHRHFPLLPYHGHIQVYFSGPVLILSGLILYLAFKHSVAGLIAIAVGLTWIIGIMYELITKM